MYISLTTDQEKRRQYYKKFAETYVKPYADAYDRAQKIPADLLKRFATPELLGAYIPAAYGGQGIDHISFGLLNELIGAACSSLRSLLTVHSMVALALMRWGTAAQKEKWLPQLANGSLLAAFALSEEKAGSNIKEIKTTAHSHQHGYELNGCKHWISFGQIADLFLVFAYYAEQPCAFLVNSKTEGISIEPINNILGTRAAMLAKIQFNHCLLPPENLLGTIGGGFMQIANTSLDLGRYSIAWGSTGISQACLSASLSYTNQRQQFGAALKQHQLVKQMITAMMTSTIASRHFCYHAGRLKDDHDPQAIELTLMAKYYAAREAYQNAGHAVEIHGANGCSADYPVERYLRDAKVMEIIEGSSEILQTMIADYGYRGLDQC